MSLIAAAVQKAESRPEQRIDYDRMNRVLNSQRAALTRAVKTGDPEKIAEVCKKAVAVWNDIGAWPDDWSNWQRALNDSLPWSHPFVDIADL